MLPDAVPRLSNCTLMRIRLLAPLSIMDTPSDPSGTQGNERGATGDSQSMRITHRCALVGTESDGPFSWYNFL